MRKSFAVALALALVMPIASAQEPLTEPLRIRSFAFNMDNPSSRNGRMDITIERWSTPQEAEMFAGLVAEKRSDKLLAALRSIHPRCGFVRNNNMNTMDLYYARMTTEKDGNRRIVLAADRPVNFWELNSSPRVKDYEFSLAEMIVGPDGKGQGKAISAAKISFNKDTGSMTIENFRREPTRLNSVEIVQPKKKK